MKRLFVTLMTLFVVACGDGGGGGGGGGAVATTPVQGDARCIQSSTLCNNGVYTTYNGWMPYSFPYGGTNYNYQTYFQSNGVCGCQYGYAPAYNSVMGMGCYRIQTGFNWNIIYSFTYNYTASNYGYAPQSGYNFQQVSGIRNGNGANCTGNIATSCLIDQANSCGAGATCQSVGTSNLGICVNGYAYNTGYNPGYGYGYGGYGYGGYGYSGYPYGYGYGGAGIGFGVSVGVGIGGGYRW